jgi:predicted AlkP superfamily pyrophosphatase or phosphodiesterase
MTMKFIITIFLFTLVQLSSFGQSNPPKLVVGIVVDQMMYDYLYRYQDRFSKGGFRLMMDKGANCRNAQYNYVPTYTGPGHASIYTGTTPKNHGIIANEWYDRAAQETVNCVTDSSYFSVGTESNYGMRSPRTLKCLTITDQLKMTYPNSKVISMSLKDRSAILPGGHLSNGSYWYDYLTGRFITSEYYTNDLPQWVKDFNAMQYPANAMKGTWNTIRPIESYTASGPDNSPYEVLLAGKMTPTFPYNFAEMTRGKTDFNLFTFTPWANTYLTDFALASMKSENLGKGKNTDFLAISYSTPDIAGHAFGPQSIEIEDMYIRLDLEIERLLNAVKSQVGKDFVVFLTADHAVVPVPQLLIDKKMPGGYVFLTDKIASLHDYVKGTFGTDFITIEENNNIYLDEELMDFMGVKKEEVEKAIALEVSKWEGVKRVFTTKDLNTNRMGDEYAEMIKNGFDNVRSGNIIFMLNPGYLPKATDTEKSRKGTSHGSAYTYDTHIPLLWYGAGINKGEILDKVVITDIVATLTHIMNLQYPNCTSGQPIISIIKK